MSLKTKVIISSVTNLSDARYATGMGVDIIGFSMNENANDFIGYTNYTAITNWLQDMKFAGEFDHESNLTDILALASEYGFTTIITPNEAIVSDLQKNKLSVVLKKDIKSSDEVIQLSKPKTTADYVLVESSNATELSQSEIALLSSSLPLLVGTKISPKTINDLIETTDIEGIALKGSEEIRTGFVDLDAMADILEAIEIE